jgi:hypothetical protein
LRCSQTSFSTQEAGNTSSLQRTLLEYFGQRWWIAILVVPSLYLIYRYPPLWKDIDAFWQLAARADAVNILQYPPVYCFLSRIPFNLASAISGHSFHHNLLSKQTPTDLGLYLLVVLQHVGLIVSLAYAVTTIAGSSRTRSILCASIFASMGGLYAQAQTCGSESWSTIALITVFAAGISLVKQPLVPAWIIYAAGLFFAIGSRHLNVLLIIWLPTIMVLLALINHPLKSARRHNWRSVIIACSIGVFIVALNLIIPRALMASIGQKYRPTIGRTLSDRVSSFLKELSPEQRTSLAQQLASSQNDPFVREAIELQASIGLGPKGTGEELTSALRESGVPNAEALEKSDRLILVESLAYLGTFHPTLLAVIGNDVWTGLSTNQQKVALSPFYSHLWTAEDMVRRPDLWKYLKGYTRLRADDANQVYATAILDPYLGLWQAMPLWLSYTVVSFVAIIGFALGQMALSDFIVIVITLLLGLAMWVANMICVYYMDRYALNLLVPVIIALVMTVGSILTGSSRSRLGSDHRNFSRPRFFADSFSQASSWL